METPHSNGTHYSEMFYTFYSSNQNVDNHFVQHRNYDFNFAMVILLQTTNGSVPSSYLSTQLSPISTYYLYAHVIYLKFSSWSCFSLMPSQIPSNASFLLRKYTSQYISWPSPSLSFSISSYLHWCASSAPFASASFLPFSLFA